MGLPFRLALERLMRAPGFAGSLKRELRSGILPKSSEDICRSAGPREAPRHRTGRIESPAARFSLSARSAILLVAVAMLAMPLATAIKLLLILLLPPVAAAVVAAAS